jgi:hypothetical protein
VLETIAWIYIVHGAIIGIIGGFIDLSGVGIPIGAILNAIGLGVGVGGSFLLWWTDTYWGKMQMGNNQVVSI